MQSNKKTKTSITTAATSHSAEIIASNLDLLTEILLRLPIKSLIKFKSVSKHWLSLISNPRFAHLCSPCPGSASGLFLKLPTWNYNIPDDCFVDLNLNSSRLHSVAYPSALGNTQSSGIQILQSCNGLILCCTSYTREESKNYFVYNPTTKHSTRLPRPWSPVDSVGMIYGLALAFDPSKSAHYKVICVRNSNAEQTRFCIDIYSSDTGPWRSSRPASFEADYINTKFEQGVFWNGSIHWMTSWGNYSLYYNVNKDKLGIMPMPPFQDDLDDNSWRWSYFGESRGHFHLVDHLNEPGDRYVNVYELERDYSKWIVKYRIDLSKVRKAFVEMIPGYDVDEAYMREYLLSVLCVVRCEVEEESYLVMNMPGKIMRYNFGSGTFYEWCDIVFKDYEESPGIVLESSDAYQYIESLACV